MSDFTRPFDYAAALLQLCEEALAETAAGTIERAYVSPGLPAIDCATLAVTVTGLGQASTSPGGPATMHRHAHGSLNLLGFAITIARDCVPVTGPTRASAPTPESLEAAALIVTSDVWVCWERIVQRMNEGDLFEGRCAELSMDSATALATSGQTAGFQLNLRAAIGGIPRIAQIEPEPVSTHEFVVNILAEDMSEGIALKVGAAYQFTDLPALTDDWRLDTLVSTGQWDYLLSLIPAAAAVTVQTVTVLPDESGGSDGLFHIEGPEGFSPDTWEYHELDIHVPVEDFATVAAAMQAEFDALA